MIRDVLLQDVREAFARLVKDHLRPFLRALTAENAASPVETIIRQLVRLQWRSQDVLGEFAGFYCVRLLLDEQSPLASYFIDLFCQLECLLQELFAAGTPPEHSPPRMTLSMLFASCLVGPALPSAVQNIPFPDVKTFKERNQLWREKVKLSGRRNRRFLGNAIHDKIRELGLTNLDQPGVSMIKLTGFMGEGAFAKVYKGVFEADDGKSKKIIGKPVAVKMFNAVDGGPRSNIVDGGGSNSTFGIPFSQSMDQQPRKLRQELHKLVSVKHPNIVTAIGYIGKRPEGDGGLVMELMDGSLHDYLQMVNCGSKPPLQGLDMLDLMLEIAKSMRFLHECDIIHRDLKPHNVLLRWFCGDDDEDLGCKLFETKLADFGLTKLLSDHLDEGGRVSRHTTFKGTTCYMAPEIRGNPEDEELPFPEKVDVFSFGTTCFNILIGNPDAQAFSKTSNAFYEAARTGKWKEWVQGCIDKHFRYMVKLIGKCWETDPALRPTFATLCLLLQHAIQCHVSAQSLRNALGAARAIISTASNTMSLCPYALKRRCKFVVVELYRPMISQYLLQGEDSVIGINKIRTWLHQFESVMLAVRHEFLQNYGITENNLKSMILLLGRRMQVMAPAEAAREFLLTGLVHNNHSELESESESEPEPEYGAKAYSLKIRTNHSMKAGQDTRLSYAPSLTSCICELMEAESESESEYGAKDYNLIIRTNHLMKADQDTRLSNAPSMTSCTCELMEVCLEKPDPLIFMKALPCYNLAERYYCLDKHCTDMLIGETYIELKNLDKFELPPSYKHHDDDAYDFSGDEAHSQLLVDESLIPLLVAFWTNPSDLPKP